MNYISCLLIPYDILLAPREFKTGTIVKARHEIVYVRQILISVTVKMSQYVFF